MLGSMLYPLLFGVDPDTGYPTLFGADPATGEPYSLEQKLGMLGSLLGSVLGAGSVPNWREQGRPRRVQRRSRRGHRWKLRPRAGREPPRRPRRPCHRRRSGPHCPRPTQRRLETLQVTFRRLIQLARADRAKSERPTRSMNRSDPMEGEVSHTSTTKGEHFTRRLWSVIAPQNDWLGTRRTCNAT